VDVEYAYKYLYDSLYELLQLKEQLEARLLVNVHTIIPRVNLHLMNDGDAIVLG